MVFVAPDRKKLEHEKHQRLVAELKETKSKGENLMIRNGSDWTDNCKAYS